jgi:hypothetical protein
MSRRPRDERRGIATPQQDIELIKSRLGQSGQADRDFAA